MCTRTFGFDCPKDLRNDAFRIAPHITFPDPDNPPTEATESTRNCSIPPPIPLNLRDPVLAIPASRKSVLSHGPAPTMPEISVTKHRDLVTPNHEVWTAREISCVQNESQAVSR